jgi:hypothetical protein
MRDGELTWPEIRWRVTRIPTTAALRSCRGRCRLGRFGYIGWLRPRLHGLDDPRFPSPVGVLIIDTSLPAPSAWRRDPGLHQLPG